MSKQKLVGTFEVWSNWVDSFGENMCESYSICFALESQANEFKRLMLETCTSLYQQLGVACSLVKTDADHHSVFL